MLKLEYERGRIKQMGDIDLIGLTMVEPWRRVAHECLAPLWAALEVDCSLFPYTCLALLSWGALTGKRFGRIDAVSEVQVYCTPSWSHCSGNVIYIRDTYSALIWGEDLWQSFTARKTRSIFIEKSTRAWWRSSYGATGRSARLPWWR